jgi:hypothetical protein
MLDRTRGCFSEEHLSDAEESELLRRELLDAPIDPGGHVTDRTGGV